MKTLLTLILLTTATFSYSQDTYKDNVWYTNYFVDEFGDFTSEPYIFCLIKLDNDLDKDTYNYIKLSIDGEKIMISAYNIYERKWGPVKANPLIKFKETDESVYPILVNSKVDDKQQYTYYDDTLLRLDIVLNLLRAKKEVKFIINLEKDKEIVVAVNAVGFSKAFDHVLLNNK